MAKQLSHVTGLDIGTTCVRAVIAESVDNHLEVVGIGETESRGLRKGVVVNPEAATESIKRAIEAAELMSGLTAETVYAGLSGAHARGENSQGVIAVSSRHREISAEDVQRVIDAACAISISSGREIADVIPQEFTVDDQDGIGDPLGMLGSRLAVSVHIVTSPIAARQNIITSVNRAGLAVADMTLTQLAAAEAVLSDDDREFGTALVNIGGETTSLSIYQRGTVWHTAIFPVGGNHFTNDIAFGLRTPIPEAERIKCDYGCAWQPLLTPDEAAAKIEVPSVGGRAPRDLSRQILSDILEPRAEEILTHIHEEIKNAGFERQLSGGVILTGGGALLTGMVEIAEQVFDAPVRLGIPEGFGGPAEDEINNPRFATALGLAIHGLRHAQGTLVSATRQQPRRAAAHSVTSSLTSRFRHIFGSFL
ncbi:MAG: cell division protein FtsA [Blastocatellia bacterium]